MATIDKLKKETLKKDLIILSQTVSKINEKRLELNQIEEDKKNAERDTARAQALKNKWEQEAKEKEERVAVLRLLEESLKRQVKFLSGKLNQEELRLLSKKILTDSERIKLDYINEVREKTSAELKKIQKDILDEVNTKDLKSKEVQEEEDKLIKLKKEQQKIQDNLRAEESRIDSKRNAQRREENALDNIRKDLDIKRKRLQKFADDNKIQIKL